MMSKLIKCAFVMLFSASVLLLLGSVKIPQKTAAAAAEKEFEKINSTFKAASNADLSAIQQKNPLILLEITVE